MHYIIFTGGTLHLGNATKKALTSPDRIIAVDSGIRHCEKLKLSPDFIVGDFDSVDPKLLTRFEKTKINIIRFPKDKDQTDSELAIDLAIKQGGTKITILGGVSGDRTDHLLSNILLLLKKKFSKIPIKFAEGNQEIYLERQVAEIIGKKGDPISFIPVNGTVKNIKSSGLKYDLAHYTLSVNGNHGISNELTRNHAKVIIPNKTLLVIHTNLE